MTKTITILPQYSCQSDFPLDFSIAQEKANATTETTTSANQKMTSLENLKPPSFWISKYKENEKPIHGKVQVIFNKGNEVPSLDAKPEFNVNWMNSVSVFNKVLNIETLTFIYLYIYIKIIYKKYFINY